MLLYLVRHAEPKREEEDPNRSLSEKGLEDITRVATYMEGLKKINVDQIFHSGKTRALQTAQVLAEHLKPRAGASPADGLAPLDAPEIWLERISNRNDDIALVGHLPHLDKLAALILCGDRENNIVTFKTCSMACLKGYQDGNWSLEWMITPELIKR